MNIYKITNITNLSAKRDFKHNSPLEISYVDNLTLKKITIKAGKSIYLTVKSLPMSVRKLRVENLITVVEVSDAEFANLMNNEPKSKVRKKTPPKVTTKSTKIKKKIDKE